MSYFIGSILVLAAFVTAGISGVLGMAGGVSLLAIMATLLPAADVVPLHAVVQLCSNGTRAVALLKWVRWPIAAVYLPPLVLGISLATLLYSGNLSWFRPVIGAFILAFLVVRRHTPRLRALPLVAYAPLGLVTGFLTLFVGGTGPFIAPFFLRDDLDKEEIVATKAVCQLGGHLLKIPAFLALGYDFGPHLPLLALLVVAVVGGTFVGRAVLTRIPERAFLLVFELVLLLLALLLLSELRTFL